MHRLRFPIALALALLAAAGPARAAEFVPGDLCLMSHALPGPSGNVYGIVRVDPVSGASSLLYQAVGSTLRDAFTYDPHRRLLIVARGDGHIVGVDADGVATTLLTVPPGSTPQVMCARGDGIVYWQVGAVFHYMDAANVLHPLLNEAGTGPYDLLPGGVIPEMRYHAGTNALVTASAFVTLPACPDLSRACAGRIPLTPDGRQVASPMTGVQADISPSAELAVGSGERADGRMVLVFDTNQGTTVLEPRLQLFDPVAMTLTPFATSGPTNNALSTGTYSNVRGQAVIDDSFRNELRGVGFGEAADGTVFSTAASGYGVSGAGHSEIARMVEITAPPATDAGPRGAAGALELAAPTPNPVRGAATLRFRLPQGAHVRLELLDVHGRRRGVVLDEPRGPGWHTLAAPAWGALDPGVYFLRLSAGRETSVRRFARVR